MSFLFLTRKFAFSFAIAVPVVVSAQSGFTPLGGEYAPAGILPGEQVSPHASVNAGGGYLVWQDQSVFGNRLSILGRVLDNNLKPAFAPFRVNSGSKGDHENPRVALLKNGGAVFVWQGGQYGFQHIYARFLSPTNTWIAIDQMVNSSSKTYQGKPSVAVLNNGNVVVVWETANLGTMRDVNGQLFSPSGVKMGNEFQVNQFTPFNQRSPSVAALVNGGFVVTWISEQQRSLAGTNSVPVPMGQFLLPSVDVHAGLFDLNAAATVADFVVNVGSSVCANPVVAAGSDGTLMFAWSVKDGQVRENGWDIFARAFTFPSSVSQIPGVQARINTQLYGDQFAPQLSATGTNYLVAWTSLGQDGSREGVYGQFLNSDGSQSGGEFRVNSTTAGAQQQPKVTSDNEGRFLAVWSSPTFGPSKNDLAAQVYIGPDYAGSASGTSYSAPVFVGDNSSGSGGTLTGTHNPNSELPALNYPGRIALGSSDSPAPNAFTLAAGSYNGLFYEGNGVNPASSGYFTAITTAGKTFNAKLFLGGKTYRLQGSFDSFGASVPQTINRSGQSSLTVSLQLDLFGGDQVRGQVKANGGWTSMLLADRQVFDKTVNQSPFAGNYTMAIPGNVTGVGSPGGSGYGNVTIDLAGKVTWLATLADGTKVSQSSFVSKAGIWPLYSYLSGGGALISWIKIEPTHPAANVNQSVTGDLLWFKRASASAKYYPAGFTNDFSVIGATYSPPPPGMHDLSVSGADVTSPLSYPLQIGTNLKVINLGSTKMSLSVNAANGRFSGGAVNPATGKTVSFQGVLLEGAGGAGFFLGGGRSGQVNLDQTHAP